GNCFCPTWARPAVAGASAAARAVRGTAAWRLIDDANIPPMAGAPVVLNTIAGAKEAHTMDGALSITTAGAPPSPTTIALLEELGIEVIHVYGLTESYGPYSVCEPQPEWIGLPVDERAA